MPCPVCSQVPNHALRNCAVYAQLSTVAHTFLESVWENFGHSGLPTQSWRVYKLCYSGALVDWEEIWGSPLGIHERLYMSVLPAYLLHVWNHIKPVFPQIPGCRMAKRCGVAQANERRDTIVVYFADRMSRDVFVDRLRAFHRQTPSLDHRPNAPARLHAGMFTLAPAMASLLGGLKGVSGAHDPGPGTSFGEKISDVATAAFNGHRNGDYEEFVGAAIQGFAAAQIDLRRPWV